MNKYTKKERKQFWVGDAPGGNYTSKVLDAAKDAKAGIVSFVDVYHDAHCAIFRGNPCNCEPDINLPNGDKNK